MERGGGGGGERKKSCKIFNLATQKQQHDWEQVAGSFSTSKQRPDLITGGCLPSVGGTSSPRCKHFLN